MASAGTVTVDFAAETAKFTAELKKVNSSLKTLENGFNSAKRIAGGFVAAFSIGALTSFVKGAADAAEQLGESANKIGISTAALKGFQLAASEAGIDIEGTTKLLLDSQKKLGEAAQGTGEAAKVIKSLGLNVRELQALSPDKLFETYAEAIKGLATRSEQLAAANALMGKSGKEAFGLILAGAPALKEAQEFVEKFGLALTEVPLKQIEDANESLGRLALISKGAGTQIAAGLAPFIEELSQKLQDMTGSTEGWRVAASIAGASVQVAFGLAANVARLLTAAFFTIAGAAASAFADTAKTVNFFVGLIADAVIAVADLQLKAARMLPDEIGADLVASIMESQAPLRAFVAGVVQATETVAASFSASAETNFEKAADALRGVQSLSQIQDGIVKTMEESRVRAEQAVAAQKAAAISGKNTLASDEDPTLTVQQYYDALNDAATATAETQKRLFGGVTEYIRAQLKERSEISRNTTDAARDGELAAQKAVADARTAALNAGLGALQTFSAESKKAAIALVLINKARAIATAIQNIGVGITAAMAGDPYTLAARIAQVKLYGAIAIAAIAASGFGEIQQINASGGAPVGSPSNPVNTQKAASEHASTADGAVHDSSLQVHIHGNFFGNRETVDYLMNQFREQINERDVVLFSTGSRQAQELGGT